MYHPLEAVVKELLHIIEEDGKWLAGGSFVVDFSAHYVGSDANEVWTLLHL